MQRHSVSTESTDTVILALYSYNAKNSNLLQECKRSRQYVDAQALALKATRVTYGFPASVTIDSGSSIFMVSAQVCVTPGLKPLQQQRKIKTASELTFLNSHVDAKSELTILKLTRKLVKYQDQTLPDCIAICDEVAGLFPLEKFPDIHSYLSELMKSDKAQEIQKNVKHLICLILESEQPKYKNIIEFLYAVSHQFAKRMFAFNLDHKLMISISVSSSTDYGLLEIVFKEFADFFPPVIFKLGYHDDSGVVVKEFKGSGAIDYRPQFNRPTVESLSEIVIDRYQLNLQMVEQSSEELNSQREKKLGQDSPKQSQDDDQQKQYFLKKSWKDVHRRGYLEADALRVRFREIMENPERRSIAILYHDTCFGMAINSQAGGLVSRFANVVLTAVRDSMSVIGSKELPITLGLLCRLTRALNAPAQAHNWQRCKEFLDSNQSLIPKSIFEAAYFFIMTNSFSRNCIEKKNNNSLEQQVVSTQSTPSAPSSASVSASAALSIQQTPSSLSGEYYRSRSSSSLSSSSPRFSARVR